MGKNCCCEQVIPKGNDLVVLWSFFYDDGTPFKLSDYEYELFYYNAVGQTKVKDTTVMFGDGNVLYWLLEASKQHHAGDYNLSLRVSLAGRQIATFDYKDAFCISNTGGSAIVGPYEVHLTSRINPIATSLTKILHAAHRAENITIQLGKIESTGPHSVPSLNGYWDETRTIYTIYGTLPRGTYLYSGDKVDSTSIKDEVTANIGEDESSVVVGDYYMNDKSTNIFKCIAIDHSSANKSEWTSTWVLSAAWNSKLSLEIESTNGETFLYGDLDTTLIAHVYRGTLEINERVTRWKWTRETNNPNADAVWNIEHKENTTEVKLTNADLESLSGKFICEAYLPSEDEGKVLLKQEIKF